jgi:hypothetical protein
MSTFLLLLLLLFLLLFVLPSMLFLLHLVRARVDTVHPV